MYRPIPNECNISSGSALFAKTKLNGTYNLWHLNKYNGLIHSDLTVSTFMESSIGDYYKGLNIYWTRPQGYKTFFMLNSTERETSTHINKNTEK